MSTAATYKLLCPPPIPQKHKFAVKAVSGPARTGKRARKQRLQAAKLNKMAVDEQPKQRTITTDAMME